MLVVVGNTRIHIIRFMKNIFPLHAKVILVILACFFGQGLHAQTQIVSGAYVNLRGCIECDSLNIGDYFRINGDTMIVDRPMLDSMIAGGYDVTKACVSHITDMSNLFNPNQFNQDIGSWDVSNVTDMRDMFKGHTVSNLNIDNWDVSSVTNMSGMFSYGGGGMNENIGSWDVSNVTDMSDMFYLHIF